MTGLGDWYASLLVVHALGTQEALDRRMSTSCGESGVYWARWLDFMAQAGLVTHPRVPSLP